MDDLRRRLVDFSLRLPEAHEDRPWGEVVAKVRRRIFVFIGGLSTDRGPGLTVKLVESHAHALSVAGALPARYGLGRAGWATVPLAAEEVTPDLLEDWIEESYRIVAPRRLVAALDRGG